MFGLLSVYSEAGRAKVLSATVRPYETRCQTNHKRGNPTAHRLQGAARLGAAPRAPTECADVTRVECVSDERVACPSGHTQTPPPARKHKPHEPCADRTQPRNNLSSSLARAHGLTLDAPPSIALSKSAKRRAKTPGWVHD